MAIANCFTVTEEDLLNFEDFCDQKYMDENCRKAGYFKIKLDQTCSDQASSMQDFYDQFGIAALKKLKKSFILSNPNDSLLYGVRSDIAPTKTEEELFKCKAFDPSSFKDIVSAPNCCMKILLKEGEDAFLQHFFTKVEEHVKCKESMNQEDLQTVLNRSVAKRAAFQRRQQFQKAKSIQEKCRLLEISMVSEKIYENNSQSCNCENCNEEYALNHISTDESALLYSANIEETSSNFLYMTKNFAMAHLCYKNMLADLTSVFAGLSYPALYLGGMHSIFPLHVEDLSLWSFNYNLHGCPKFWLIVPPTAVRQLSDALCAQGFQGLHKWCRNSLGHKFYFPTVDWLKRENIPFEIVIQYEGEGIVLLPNTPHTGGNTGFNLAQACNFGTKKWIPYGCVAPQCPCMPNAVHFDMKYIVAVHMEGLLKDYLTNNILNVAVDQHFLKSVIVLSSRTAFASECSEIQPHVSSQTVKRRKLQGERLKCPICDVSWASKKKKNVLAHLSKYHSGRMEEDMVQLFLTNNFPDLSNLTF